MIAASSILASAVAARDVPGTAAALTAPVDPAGYYQRLQRARDLIAKQDYTSAEPLLEQLAKDYPLDRLNWSLLATAKRSLNKCAEAIPAYAKSIELIGPWPSTARYWTAVCELRLGHRDRALEALRKHVEEDRTTGRPSLMTDPELAALKDDVHFRKIAGEMAGPRPSRTAGLRSDLDYLMAEIKRLSPHYRTGPLPGRTMAGYRALYRAIPELSDAQVYARMAMILGTLDANHTLFRRLPGVAGKGSLERYLPLTFYAFPEGFYVVNAEAGQDRLIGKRLVSIAGIPADEVFRRVASVMSTGADSELYWTGPLRLSEAHLLKGLGVLADDRNAKLRLADSAGSIEDTEVVTGTTDNFAKLVPPRNVAAPLFLSRVKESHWFEMWPAQSTAYVQVNQIAPDPDEDLAQFGLRLRKALDESKVRNVILDLRHNNGGNTFTYVELLRTLVAFSARDGNRLYVLIGRNVYSAAANLSTDLERLASPVFVGEPTGDFGNQEGDEGMVRLPYSGWSASIGAVWWQLSHPWDRRRYIAPQVPVQLTAKSYFAGEDPALETTKNLIAARSQ